MIFDLKSGKRRRVVQIIFGFLAFIFAAGFIFLGIGTEGGLNPFDSLGGGSTDDAFEQQIEDAEAEVEDNPADADAISSLIVLRAQSGTAQLEVDEETGQPSGLSDESRAEYEEAVARWQDYLETKPKKISPAAAGAVVQAYRFLGDVEGAIAAQRQLAESSPSAPNYGALAQFLYFDLQIDEGDKARDKALAEASSETKKLISQQLEQIRDQGVKAEKKQKKQPDSATGDAPAISDPFGGLTPTDPSTQVAP